MPAPACVVGHHLPAREVHSRPPWNTPRPEACKGERAPTPRARSMGGVTAKSCHPFRFSGRRRCTQRPSAPPTAPPALAACLSRTEEHRWQQHQHSNSSKVPGYLDRDHLASGYLQDVRDPGVRRCACHRRKRAPDHSDAEGRDIIDVTSPATPRTHTCTCTHTQLNDSKPPLASCAECPAAGEDSVARNRTCGNPT